MQLTWADKKNQMLIPLVLALMSISLPISSTAKSVFSVCAVLLIVSTRTYYQDLKNTLSSGWCRAAIGLFLIAFLACFWGDASLHQKLVILEKYNKLLFLPILAVGFSHEKNRTIALNAFLIAMTLTVSLSILKHFQLIALEDVNPGNVFRNYIITGYLVAFSAYLSLWFSMQHRGIIKFIYWSLWLFYTYQMIFVNTGRTGLLAYTLLMLLFVVQFVSKKQAIIFCLLALLFGCVLIHKNQSLHDRVYQVVGEIKDYQANKKETSLGYRIQFHQFAKHLFLKNIWFGNGAGGFTHAFDVENPIPSWDKKLLEPHSQYWLVAAEFGILGLIGLTLFFVSLLIAALQMQIMKPIALGLLIPFLIGNFTDSMLLISGVGFFFIAIFAVCLGELIEKGVYAKS